MTIQEILEAHTLVTVGSIDDINDKGGWRSECLGCEWVEPHSDERREHHRAHLAEVLEKHMQEQEAAEVERLAKVIEDEGEGYARTAVTLTGADNTRYHAYASARQGIANQLKFRADQIRKATTNGR
ncbi:hypothetical protein CIK76_05040 [Glutamicibacter sp. BW80]|uniref:hypothetical protein n=1 Tax=Glutamicibacter sp. BW80 TaxID=2024404 RepID=UPI000BB6A2DF|nr:hypothetical protein [Glutamicibacter sp. BW80]PCC29759.1 hypothetical protein CIK76_05040 [Glutamicibacter sp. BW80]